MTNTAAAIVRKAGSAIRLGMMPADGIGREVLPCAQRVLQNTPGAPKFEFLQLAAGFEHFQKTGSALPDETIRALKEECDGAMFGSVSSPSHKVEGYSSPIVRLRKELDLYANIRPVIGVRGTKDDEKWVDTVIVRENTECLVSETCRMGSAGGAHASHSTSSPRRPSRRPRARWLVPSGRSARRPPRALAARPLRWLSHASRCARRRVPRRPATPPRPR